MRTSADLRHAWRRTGADLPFGDPRASHRAEMEGWFWRTSDVEHHRAVVVLCGVNRHPDGDWATVAVAADPGGLVRHAAVDGAEADEDRFALRAGDVLRADASGVTVDIDDVHVELRLRDPVGWPRSFLHGSGLVSVLPGLGQYWHPHVLGGGVTGHADLGPLGRWTLDGSRPYAERNWGHGFPHHWWWAQAQAFDDPEVCVAFAGGHLLLPGGRRGIDLGGVAVRLGTRIVRLTPPAALVRTTVDGRWRITARSPRWRIEAEGDPAGSAALELPVPLPAERRNVMNDFEHQDGRLHLRMWHDGREVFSGTSVLAALEIGSTDHELAASMAAGIIA